MRATAWTSGFFIALSALFSARANAWLPPEWRPDGTTVACAHIPIVPNASRCRKGETVGWPHQDALLVSISPKEVPAFPRDWEEFRYYYFAPYLSLRCASLRS